MAAGISRPPHISACLRSSYVDLRVQFVGQLGACARASQSNVILGDCWQRCQNKTSRYFQTLGHS